MTKAIGYTRVSTAEQSESGLGLAAQRSAIEAECRRRGWQLVQVLSDAGVSGKSTRNRPALTEALRMVEAGEADAVVVSKLDRLSRSLKDFAASDGTGPGQALEPGRARPRRGPVHSVRRVHGQRAGLRRPMGTPRHRCPHQGRTGGREGQRGPTRPAAGDPRGGSAPHRRPRRNVTRPARCRPVSTCHLHLHPSVAAGRAADSSPGAQPGTRPASLGRTAPASPHGGAPGW